MLSFAAIAVCLLSTAAPSMASVSFPMGAVLEARTYEQALVGRATPAKGAIGAKCRFNANCQEAPNSARPSCNAKGVCDFVCLNTPILVKKGNACVVNPALKSQCTTDSQCASKTPNRPSNSDPICLYNQCTYTCSEGFHKVAGKCYKNQDTCGGKTCAPIAGGTTFCNGDGECVYRCNQALGFTLFTNSKQTAYRCVDLGMDAENCGSANNVCPGGYNGLGTPACAAGSCTVDCAGLTKVTKNGRTYCTKSA